MANRNLPKDYFQFLAAVSERESWLISRNLGDSRDSRRQNYIMINQQLVAKRHGWTKIYLMPLQRAPNAYLL